MRTARVILALAALVGLSGCPEDCPDCEPPCFPGAPSPGPAPGLLLVGEPARLTFQETIILNGGCNAGPGGSPTATSEVYDPQGALVPSTVTFNSADATHTIQFTPERPGSHHIYVLFSPTGGLHQFDVLVAIDRSAEAPVYTLPEVCASLERTRQGAWVCDSTIYRGDVVEQRLEGAWLTVAGDVVWAVEPSRIRRFVDTGTALTQTASLTTPLDTAEFLLASPDELLVLHSSTLKRYTFSGDTLQTSAPASWSSGGQLSGGLRGLLLREGDQLAVVSKSPSTSRMQVCPYQLTPTGPVRKQGPCQTLEGTLMGFEPSALWEEFFFSSNDGRTTLRRSAWSGGQLTEYASQFVVPPLQTGSQPLVRRSSAVPIVRSVGRSEPLVAVVTAAPTERMLLFQRLDKDIPDALASPALYWGRPATLDPARPLRIRSQPSAP